MSDKKNEKEIQIIYEDENMVVINKPVGFDAHSDGISKIGSPLVSDWVLKNYPDNAKIAGEFRLAVGGTVPRIGIVHRLDRETSGVMVIGKTEEAFNFLVKQFEDRKVMKKYHAFVYGKVADTFGVIDKPIARSRENFRQWSSDGNTRGSSRDAITEYSVIKSSDVFSFVEARPKTGRTHQIRVHMKSIGHPVICDKLYAPERPMLLGFSRLALHAVSLQIDCLDGVNRVFEAGYPEDFIKAIDEISIKFKALISK